MSPLDDRDARAFLRLAHAGDDDAWRTIASRYADVLRRVADFNLDARLRARFDPDDVVQEALFDAFSSLGRYFETTLPFSIWLRQRVLDRVCRIHRDHLGTRARDAARDAGATATGLPPVDPGTSPSGWAMRGEAGRLVRAALDLMDEDDREIIFLFHIQGLPHLEIGAMLGLKPDAVRKRLQRAVARFGDLLRSLHPEWCHAVESVGPRP